MSLIDQSNSQVGFFSTAIVFSSSRASLTKNSPPEEIEEEDGRVCIESLINYNVHGYNSSYLLIIHTYVLTDFKCLYIIIS